jgi:Mor family transcriptional regulator
MNEGTEMKYINAADILPKRLLQELQIYSGGNILYIPKAGAKADWGAESGSKSFYQERNLEIKALYRDGKSVDELALRYGLSNSTIKRIIYS